MKRSFYASVFAKSVVFVVFLLSIPIAGLASNLSDINKSTSQSYASKYESYILMGVNISDDFKFNDTMTTPFGPAYANIWTKTSNFLSCNPPQDRDFSYALCYYSGPSSPTGISADNPALPCTLTADGKVANCKCYKLSTRVVPPQVPYYVDINAIINLDVYEKTIEVCGKNGQKCTPSTSVVAPVCYAINANRLVPGADLVSVFSPVKKLDYFAGSTNCQGSSVVYAGCMTAPCRDTGETDANGTPLVDCSCPVYAGPFEIGQGPGQGGQAPACDLGSGNVWSAAHNPKENNPINPVPPAGECTPDAPPEAGCPLYSSTSGSSFDPGSPICKAVCEAYGTPNSSGSQTAYACDSTLCTALGIGQQLPLAASSVERLGLIEKACKGIQSLDGLALIAQVRSVAGCSCCASQLCGCADPGDINDKTNRKIYHLNKAQQTLGITPQCAINGTLCGAQ